MRRIIRNILILVGFSPMINGFSQSNLVLNGGFEKKRKCPSTLGDFYTSGWHSTLYGRKTPDYFSLCSADDEYSSPKSYIINVKPFEGDAYVGLVGYNPHNGYREYITTKLSQPLEKGVQYDFQITVSQPALSLYYISNLGVVLTNDSLNHYKMPGTLIDEADLNIEPKEFVQCRNSWTTYTIRFTAKGGEQYIHLGCFLTDEKLLYRTYKDRKTFCNKTGYRDAYYLFDDVKLTRVEDEIEVAEVEEQKEQQIELKLKDFVDAVPTKTLVFEDIKFNTGDFSSNEKYFLQFADLITYLKDNAELTVLIEGHTDDIGSIEDNQLLSEERTLFVKSYFQGEKISNNIFTKGYGESKPVYPNDSRDNRAKNRRVVIKLF